MNLFTQQKQSHGYRKQTYGYQGISGEGINWEIGTDIYTLLYIKQISIDKDLLYSTGNSTQWSVLAYTEKESYKKKQGFWDYIININVQTFNMKGKIS